MYGETFGFECRIDPNDTWRHAFLLRNVLMRDVVLNDNGLCVCNLWGRYGYYDGVRALYFDFSASPLYVWRKWEGNVISFRMAFTHTPDFENARMRSWEEDEKFSCVHQDVSKLKISVLTLMDTQGLVC